MNFNLKCIHTLRLCHSWKKWSVPRELLSSSVSTEKKESVHSSTMKKLLREKFPKALSIKVKDLSGNCGSMYEVVVVSSEFDGLPLVKQHMLVTEVLSREIRNMHGIRIETKVPNVEKKSSS